MCHLTINPEQCMIIAVTSGSVSLFGCIIKTFQSHWCLIHIPVYASEQIVRQHTVVG